MTTVTTGTFFLARKPYETEVDRATGVFRLTLRAVDRQGPGRTEAYVAIWAGPAAAMWFNENQPALQPGRGVQLELHNPRSFAGRYSPETHATVVRCQLAPVAPSWMKHSEQSHAAPQPGA